MLTKIGNLLLNEKRIDKYRNISFIFLIAGLFLFISLPLLSDRIFITEKQMKNSDVFHFHYKFEHFVEDVKEFFTDENVNIKERLERVRSLKNKGEESEIVSYDVKSQRGEKNKFLMVNSIYEGKGEKLFPIYGLIKFFSKPENFRWLTKDIQFNFIPKDMFYNQPSDLLQKLTSDLNPKIREGFLLDFVINIDLNNFDFDYIDKILFQTTGANSEIVDMDYYKVLFDNFLTFYPESKMTTVDYFFNRWIKFYLKNIFYNIGSLIEGFFPKNNSNKIQFGKDFVYFLENIFANYLLAGERINTNHLLISKGINSILLKGIKKPSKNISKNYSLQESEIRKYSNENFLKNSLKIKKYHQTMVVFERAIKVMSISEIEIFRGDQNYLLTNSHSFTSVAFFLFIPVLCVLRIFYEVLYKIYKSEVKIYEKEEVKQENSSDSIQVNNSIQASKVIFYLIFSFSIEIFFFLSINEIGIYIQFSLYSIFFHILIINFAISFIFFRMMKLNKYEEIFVDNAIRFIIALNCFNIFFANYGIGIFMTVTLLPLDILLVYFNEKLNRIFLQIFSVMFLLYCMLMDRSVIEIILDNYVNHFNNVYPLVSVIIIILLWRINLIIRRWLNLGDRIKDKLE